ncbi:serine hydrolase domain-containing protein [Hoeflea sp.]|uniref:serine hydrolase domain-containing protein n=1 Tax=Hoeflea sp. TaxID=1940281 RepID=UPI003BB05998
MPSAPRSTDFKERRKPPEPERPAARFLSPLVEGYCQPEFAAVADAFCRNFVEHGELGASVCLMQHGRTVVDLWGGYSDAACTRRWREDSLCLIFSNTKALAAICVHALIDAGLLAAEDRVVRVWPEFGSNGKSDVTVGMLLNHTSGMVAFRDKVERGANADWDYMIDRIANERPFWEPGKHVGYQMFTHGWLLGEIVRRVTGMSMGTFLARNIAQPNDLDLYLGLPVSEFDRLAPVEMFVPDIDNPEHRSIQNFLGGPGSMASLALFNTGITHPNSEDQISAELGAHGAVANARSLCRLFSLLERDLSCQTGTIMSARQADRLVSPSSETAMDLSFLIPMRYSQGLMLRNDNREFTKQRASSLLIGRNAFGHAGWGGSFVFADPDTGIAMSYVLNRLTGGRLVNKRGQGLIDAAYQSADPSPR